MEELALHILDLVQNCVEAQASWVYIRVAEDPALNTLSVSIEDNGRGMNEEQQARAIDPFYTTRTTRKVGLGIPLLKAAAEDTGGSFTITSAPGRGTLIEASFVRDHIDRVPVGNMADTLSALLALHNNIELRYEHVVGDRSFCLSTAVLREICGDELSHPRIVSWLRSYISEQENSLEV
jgi:anti-sigma regulatory factor (Ser/Thr protein kinase)